MLFENFCVEKTGLSGLVMQLAVKSSAEISKPIKYFIVCIVLFLLKIPEVWYELTPF